MDPMHLPEIENHRPKAGKMAEGMRAHEDGGLPIPQIWHLFAWKPEATEHLMKFTQAIMRGPSELSSGTRELIAAFTSKRNDCLF
jgi:alkylhydroperoxidase family enzyme